MNNIDRYLSLVKELVGKKLVTEEDSPSDFSMRSPADTPAADTASVDTSNVDTGDVNVDSSATDTSNSANDSSDPLDNFEMSSQDLDIPSTGGGLGLSSGDGDGSEEMQNMDAIDNSVPKYKILDIVFDPDDDLNTQVKVQNMDTEEISTKNLLDIDI